MGISEEEKKHFDQAQAQHMFDGLLPKLPSHNPSHEESDSLQARMADLDRLLGSCAVPAPPNLATMPSDVTDFRQT